MLEVIVGCEGVYSAALQTVELSVCTRMHTDRHLHLFKVWKNGRIKKGRMHVNWIVGDLSLLQQRPLNSRAGSKPLYNELHNKCKDGHRAVEHQLRLKSSGCSVSRLQLASAMRDSQTRKTIAVVDSVACTYVYADPACRQRCSRSTLSRCPKGSIRQLSD